MDFKKTTENLKKKMEYLLRVDSREEFEILDFDIEKQFVNPDVNKLSQLASQTQGKVYYPNQADELIKSLLENENYKAIEKAIVKKTPLIDWIWLLLLIAITLSLEWFIRKYNGLL
jgi:hypothetical protein